LGCDGDFLNEYGYRIAAAFIVSFLLAKKLGKNRNKFEFDK